MNIKERILMGLFDENENKTIDDYAEEGNSFFDLEKYDDAIGIWKLGLDAVSDPENAQSESVWFQTSIADAYFMQDKFSEAYGFFSRPKRIYPVKGIIIRLLC